MATVVPWTALEKDESTRPGVHGARHEQFARPQPAGSARALAVPANGREGRPAARRRRGKKDVQYALHRRHVDRQLPASPMVARRPAR